MRRLAGMLGALVLVAGCGKTEECKKLERVKRAAQSALAAAKGRAQLAERTGEHLARLKAAVEKKLDDNGLDLDEGALIEALEERVESVAGATLERTTRPAEVTPGSLSRQGATETVFRFTFEAKGLEAAWSKAQVLMSNPPLTRLLSLIAPKKPGEPWRLDLGRVDIQRLPMKIEPRPVPPRPKASEVPSELGFCGASQLREEIAALEEEIAKYAEQAEQTTVNLPLTASWTGLSRRADLAIDSEAEGRRLAEGLVEAVLESGQRFLGLASEPEAVLLEVVGDEKAAKAVQSELPEPMLQAMQELPPSREGVARIAIGNRVSAAGRRPEKGGGHPGPGGH